MSWSNYVLFSIKTLNFRELIEEIFVEPKRIQNIIGQIFLGGI